jgi:hypothetical protein
MSKVFFVKELLTNAYLVGGKAVPFIALHNNRGIIELDTETDAVLATALSEAASKSKGGIVRVTAEQAEEVKKNSPPLNPSEPQKPKDVLRIMPDPKDLFRRRTTEADAAPAAVDPSLGALLSKSKTPVPDAPAQATEAKNGKEAGSGKFKPATKKVTEEAAK